MLRHRDHHWGLVLHTHLLRASMTLYADRERKLAQTAQRLGHSRIPSDRADFDRMLMETAKELGGIQTRMILDAPWEMQTHYFGPLQVALALFHAMIVRYRELFHADPVYQDAALDGFCRRHAAFVNDLESMRHSVLHQRPDNQNVQVEFLTKYTQEDSAKMLSLLAEGAAIYDDYVKRLRQVLKKDGARA